MEKINISKLTENKAEEGLLLILAAEEKVTRKGDPYVILTLTAPDNAEDMFDYLTNRLSEVAEKGSAAAFAVCVYELEKETILKWAAAKSMHHNYLSGWFDFVKIS